MSATQIISSFIAGAIGSLALEFVGRPLRKFVDLRGEVIRQMVVYGNVRARWKEVRDNVGATSGEVEDLNLPGEEVGRLEDAKKTLRDLAAQLKSFEQNEWLASRIVRHVFRFNLRKASAGLIGMSNAIDTYGSNRAFQTKAIEDAFLIGA